VLRATLAVGDAHEAPLETELRLARGYAAVMAERFSGRVEIAWDIDKHAQAASLPVMTLQPLLENVFKHTVEKTRACTRIAVKAMRGEHELVVRIEDDRGTLASSQSPGIGLKNLRERLARLYGERATLTLSQLAPAGVCAELRVPCAS
jgi:LytS/YehU family sensor histidine kinase